MKNKVTFQVVVPGKSEAKKLRKIITESANERFDLSKATHPDGTPVKHKKKSKKAS
ncbi:hypothetical protein LPTSP4_09200 [Leptospira ryugenii]|uniref:Uncharacterized protein n=1 Tax=Leptospira ryugenii TaxID=1917863 RepID=A0A2P2DXQ1_9LEPT|nr:hypothetical protein [Leptospira ryugenii]GBF49407.1 hypothetical protein LPTSP4_09200 [Leptospira ryugenii]